MEKEREKIIFMDVWLERGEKGKLVEWGCFLSSPTKMCSPQIKENTREKKASHLWMKEPMCKMHMVCHSLLWCLSFFFWFSSLAFVFLRTSQFFFSHLFWMFWLMHFLKNLLKKKKNLKCLYTIFLTKKMLPFVLFNRDIIINLHQFNFSSSHFYS